jgi:uncharacterized protein (DUF952 family)
MPEILHITPRARWEQAVADGEYRGDTLATEGFIHCSTPGQLPRVAETFYQGQTGLVVLRIDPDKLKPPLRWEHPPDSDERYPHVYGPLNLDAVAEVVPLEEALGGEAGRTPAEGEATSETSEPASEQGVKTGSVTAVLSLLRAGRERLLAGTTPRQRRWTIRAVKALVTVAILWLLAAYVVLPALWRHYEHHPALEDAPKTTVTAQGIPGDPLNVGLIGTEDQLVRAMLDAGWDPADPVTFKTSLRIARSVLLNKPYADAPVSGLYLFGRKQDLAFERPVGKSVRQRHHVRFWKSAELGRGGVPLWIGAVTFDRSVGLSHRTGQVTHHIGPDIDAERDGLIAGLRNGGWLSQIFQVTGVGATLVGRNGGGDRYDTDGELTVGVLILADERDQRPERLDNPVAVQIKEQLWTAIRPLLRSLPGQ